jgi:hypothetical protein
MLLLSAATAVAQVTGGSVNGTVTDANGAALPNATITLTSKATGQTLSAQSTGSGAYNFPNVAVGEYEISITANGFANAKQVVTVALNQNSTVDATLQAGGVNATNIVLVKNVYFRENLRMQLGVEVFDLFNGRPQTIGTALSPSAQQAGLQQNATFISVGNGVLFNNYNLGDFSGRELTFRAKIIF